jgi:hypothetical protein
MCDLSGCVGAVCRQLAVVRASKQKPTVSLCCVAAAGAAVEVRDMCGTSGVSLNCDVQHVCHFLDARACKQPAQLQPWVWTVVLPACLMCGCHRHMHDGLR